MMFYGWGMRIQMRETTHHLKLSRTKRIAHKTPEKKTNNRRNSTFSVLENVKRVNLLGDLLSEIFGWLVNVTIHFESIKKNPIVYV